MQKENWWKKAVIYQIYPRSFQDSNGDGIGDLQGIISRMDYLAQLGVDAIWLSPVCQSPQDDNGYDISDYQDIDPMFGTLQDMEALIEKAKEHGIRIILDLVLNHTSDRHRWFQEARKSRENPYHDYYVWRDGEEGVPPTEMKACFGGPAWEWVPELGQYYYHQFAVSQPDLNWKNEAVRRELFRMINWWTDKGIGGFRLDVIDQIAKEPELMISDNGPLLHEYIKEMSAAAFQRNTLVTVGETWGADTERAKQYSNPDGSELSMVFQFEHICLDQQDGKEKWDLYPLNFIKLKQTFAKWQVELYQCGWNSLFWDNHDLPRIVSRFGDDGKYRLESAKMLATVLHGMQGTPYIFQGEELGMTNVKFAIEDYRDIETLNMYEERKEKGYPEEEIMNSVWAKGRDNARTPMQWSTDDNAGFTKGIPWIKVNPNYLTINAAHQMAKEDSIFHYYCRLIALRKKYEIFAEGDFRLCFEEHPDLFVYTRKWKEEELLVAANFHDREIPSPLVSEWGKHWEGSELLLGNYQEKKSGLFLPYEARIYRMY